MNMEYFNLKTSEPISEVSVKNLKSDESYFSNVFEALACVLKNSHNGMLVFRALYSEDSEIIDFECVFANPSAENIFSVHGCLAGRRLLKDFTQLNDGSFFEFCKKVVFDGKTVDYEHGFVVDDSQKWFRSVVMKNGSGIVINISDITNQKKDKIELQYMIAINEIITQISTKFINVNVVEIDNEIKTALDYLSEFLNIDYSYFFWINSDKDYIKSIYSNSHGNAAELIAPFYDIEISKLSGILSIIHESVELDNLNVIYEILQNCGTDIEVEFFKILKNKAEDIFIVPVLYANRLNGFLILAFSAGTRKLAKQIISFSKVLGEIFANALIRKQSEEKLLRFNDELEQTVLRRTNELQSSLKEKEILLKEVHHRVKNNLQIITSILKLQSANIKNPEMANLFKIVTGRIKTMALMHEKLYQSSDLANINFSEYIKNLANYIYNTFCEYVNDIEFEVNFSENILLDVDSAISCGLIINELVTNALKYAFKDKGNGKIIINFMYYNDPECVLNDEQNCRKYNYLLSVGDNGSGIEDGYDIKNSGTLGMQIVMSLVEELEGKLEIVNSNNGLRFNIFF